MDEAGLQMAASCTPVLTDFIVRSAPVLEEHHFRLGLIHFGRLPERGNNQHA
jgi:hypothetical protein